MSARGPHNSARILKVTVERPRRFRKGPRQERFEIRHPLFDGYRLESSSLSLPGTSSQRDARDLLAFPEPTATRVERRLTHRRGRRKGRILKLYQGAALIGVLSFHIDRKGRIVILHAQTRGLRSQRQLQIKLLLKGLRDLNEKRVAHRARKAILWRPADAEQMSLARQLGFTETAERGKGKELPVLKPA
jgi:hypothetical protein